MTAPHPRRFPLARTIRAARCVHHAQPCLVNQHQVSVFTYLEA